MLADWVNTAQGVVYVAQAIAIAVGGVWAYFKFIRGRTFARRAEVGLSCSLFTSDGAEGLRVAVTVHNTGASKIVLDRRICVVYLFAVTASRWRPPANIDWGDHLSVTPILRDHGWIEAQEIITDEVLVPTRRETPVDDETILAYRILCKVIAKRVRWRRKLLWSGDKIIPVGRERATEAGTAPLADTAEPVATGRRD